MRTVSVIIPTYNRASYLPACLDSVFAQTFTDFEVIVVDDGSTDNTREVLEPWIQAKRVQYIRQNNKGQDAASNVGLNRANCELIAFLDSDDFWPPDKLEWQVRYLEEHPDAGVIGGGVQAIDESGSEMAYCDFREGKVSFEQVFSGPPFASIGQTMVRAQLLREAGGLDESLWVAGDFDLWMKLARRTTIVKLPKVALFYRQHQSNLSSGGLIMCQYCQRLVERHLPYLPASRRTGGRLTATRWLYGYRGATLIVEWKLRLRKGNWGDSWNYAKTIGWFLRGALRDRQLLATIWKELIPARFAQQ